MPHGVSGTPIKPLSTLDLAFAQTTFRAPDRVYAIDIMGMFGDWGRPEHQQAYDQVYGQQQQHEGSFTHEALAGAASFMAMREYEKHESANGQPPNHQFAKEMIAGIAGGEVDKLCETKGLDYIDRERAKRQAQENAMQMYDNSYGQQQLGGQQSGQQGQY